LEAVEVEEHAGELRGAPARALRRLLERGREAGAVGKAGERVLEGERGDALAGEHALGDVAPDAAVAEEAAVGRTARLAAYGEVARGAVPPRPAELEVAERLARLHLGAQRRPSGLVRVGR